VVGSGLAGLECARTLAAGGWRVEVISAGRVGRDGATHRVHALAPWILLTAPWVKGDSPDRFLADLKRRGEGAQRDGLAEVLAAEAHTAARELMAALDLVSLGEGPSKLEGDELPRGMRCVPRDRHSLLAPLLTRCEAAGVRLSGRSLAVGLVSDGRRVAGALVLDRTRNEARRAEADAVVLACGGVGAVFPVTTVPRWVRGTGLALASAAGVLLHRPELTQALPVIATPPLYFPTSAALLSGRVTIDGQPLAGATDLDTITRSVAEGLRRGAGAFLEPGGEPAEVLPPRLRGGAAAHAAGRVPLTAALHHAIGGVAIDTWGRTSVTGLYACGEAAGGVQGRRRTMGTGLLEAYVFGRRAALAAIRDLERRGPAPTGGEVVIPPTPSDAPGLEDLLDRLLGPLTVLRPAEEVSAAASAISAWPIAVDSGVDERGAMAGIRRSAALAVLASETEPHPGPKVVGLHGAGPAPGA
jgi:aspartate oxidase